MNNADLVSALDAVRGQLRARLETNAATPDDLRAGLEEIQVLWDELRSQSDALAQERKRYADFFEHAPDAYLITEPNGVIREANRAAGTLLGRSQAELGGKAIWSLVAEDAQPQFRAHLVASRGNPTGTGKDWQSPIASGAGQALVAFKVRAIKVRHKNADAMCWLLRAVDKPET